MNAMPKPFLQQICHSAKFAPLSIVLVVLNGCDGDNDGCNGQWVTRPDGTQYCQESRYSSHSSTTSTYITRPSSTPDTPSIPKSGFFSSFYSSDGGG